jgi:hypothetical protein
VNAPCCFLFLSLTYGLTHEGIIINLWTLWMSLLVTNACACRRVPHCRRLYASTAHLRALARATCPSRSLAYLPSSASLRPWSSVFSHRFLVTVSSRTKFLDRSCATVNGVFNSVDFGRPFSSPPQPINVARPRL